MAAVATYGLSDGPQNAPRATERTRQVAGHGDDEARAQARPEPREVIGSMLPIRKSDSTYVYFIQAHLSVPEVETFPGHVKIGKAADVVSRYVTLRWSTPPEVSLVPLGFLHADDYTEEQLHVRFSRLRHRSSEWFAPEPQLLSLIEQNAEEFPPLDEWGRPADQEDWDARLQRVAEPAQRKANQHPDGDANATDDRGHTALHRAAYRGSISKVRYLVEGGAEVRATDVYGGTALHRAAIRGATDVVRYLVEQGAQVNAAASSGWTPLHEASSWGRLDAVRYLAEHGADLEAGDYAGQTPLHRARNNATRALLRELGARDV